MIHVLMNTTLDGCCDHTQVIADDEHHEYATDELNRAEVLLFGRNTYDLIRGYWQDIAATGKGSPTVVRFARLLEAKPKHLVSSHPPAPGWNTSLLPRDENGNAVRALRQAVGGTILVMASPTLVRALAEWGLVDEYHLAIQPILAGRGPTFLAGLRAPIQVTLKEARALKSGVALHRYAVGR